MKVPLSVTNIISVSLQPFSGVYGPTIALPSKMYYFQGFSLISSISTSIAFIKQDRRTAVTRYKKKFAVTTFKSFQLLLFKKTNLVYVCNVKLLVTYTLLYKYVTCQSNFWHHDQQIWIWCPWVNGTLTQWRTMVFTECFVLSYNFSYSFTFIKVGDVKVLLNNR